MITEQQSKCPALEICSKATGINCVGRPFLDCRMFQHLLAEYCKRHSRGKSEKEACRTCKYPKLCQREEKEEVFRY